MKKLLLFIVTFCVTGILSAQTFNAGGINYEVTSTIAPTTVKVGNNAGFAGAANIPASVIDPNTSISYDVTSIGYAAFGSCIGLTSVTIPNSVTSIGTYGFSFCNGLTSVTIPDSVISIGHYAFISCIGLTSVTIPNSVVSIGRYAFSECIGLTSVTIPNTLTIIDTGVFNNCRGLTSVVIPNSVSSIGQNAFISCIGLTSVTIPNSVLSIDNAAFANCNNLNTVNVMWQTPLPISSSVFYNTNINSTTLNVPSGTESLYEAAPVWTDFNIAGGAPRGCWASVSTGGFHTLAIAQDGSLWAWGDNAYKQLGNNSALASITSPVQVSNATDWAFVSAGEHYSLAIKKDGTLWAWGKNDFGQIGNNTITQQNVPIQIGIDTNWAGVFAGFSHSIAKKSDGSLWAWGRNNYGQIGNNTIVDQLTPVQVGADLNWRSVSLGRTHTVGLKSNGQLWSWGRNNFGQLGIGNTTQQNAPIQIGTDVTWSAIQVGEYHNLALKSNGTLYTWGDNLYGQLGLGDTSSRNSPTQVGADINWKFIASGLGHSYATKSTGTLWSWGDNYNGQLGNNAFTQQNSPVQVGTATDWYSIIAGNNYGVAQKNAGNFLAWGDNQSGQLGNGTTTPNTTGVNAPGVMSCAGNILAFDGSDDRVRIANSGTGVLGDNSANESYTVEMKVKLNTVASNKLFSKNGNAPSNQGFTIETDASGNLFFEQAYGGVFSKIQTASPLAADTWYRIVATFDYATKTHKLYLNAALVGSKTEAGTPNFGNYDTGLGYSYGYSSGKLDGKFNDLRVWNVERTSIEVGSYTRNSQVQNSLANLVLHFQFNQGIANTNNSGLTLLANEVFGSSINGTLENFALTGSNSNWTFDVTANETVILSTDNFSVSDTIKIYPNPSTGIFNISLEEDADVEIFDLLGKKVFTNNLKSGVSKIDISNYQSGLYILNVKSDKGSVMKKIIKK